MSESLEFLVYGKQKRISRIIVGGSDQRLARFDQVIAVTQYPQVKLRFYGACRSQTTRYRWTRGGQVSDDALPLLLARV